MSSTEKIAVLGAGSWGATLASLLSEQQHSVCLWSYKADDAAALKQSRRLTVIPELVIPQSLRIESDLAAALEGATLIVCAVPSQGVRATAQAIAASRAFAADAMIVNASKGLDLTRQQPLSEVFQEELNIPATRTAVLSGPSHAEEVCRKLPTAIVAASSDRNLVMRVQRAFNTDSLRVYAHDDSRGVEIAAALKNVYAIACGISDGLGFGDNTRAAIMTRGLNEMVRIGTKMGAQLLTFFGLAGMGDLAVTCMSPHSRNHLLGEKIGQGQSTTEALAAMTMVAEGYRTAPSAHALAERFGLDCPLTREIYEVLYREKNPRSSLRDLMTRSVQGEWQGHPIERETGL